jgi:uncharacterized membrane protein
MFDFFMLGFIQLFLLALPIVSLARSFRLERQIRVLQARLTALEGGAATPPSPSASQPPHIGATPAGTSAAPVRPAPVSGAQATVPAPPAPIRQPSVFQQRPSAEQQPNANTQPRTAVPPKRETPNDVESLLGGHILSRIGVVAVLIGLVYFYLWAVDQGWITEWVRVAIGTMAGAGAFVAARSLQKRSMTSLGQAVAALGSGALILTIHAAYAWYDLVPFMVAYCALLASVLVTMWQADAHRSVWLAGVASVTGMLVPAILSSANPSATGLLTHVALIDMMIIGTVLMVKRWAFLSSIAALGTVSWLAVGTMTSFPDSSAATIPAFLLLFLVAGPLVKTIVTRAGVAMDVTLSVSGVGLYMFAVVTLLAGEDYGVAWIVADAVALAVLAVILHRQYADRMMEAAAMITSIVLISVYCNKLPAWQWPLVLGASLVVAVGIARMISSILAMWAVLISGSIGVLTLLGPFTIAIGDHWPLYPFANVIVAAGVLLLLAIAATVWPWKQWTDALQPIDSVRSAVLLGGVFLMAMETFRIVRMVPQVSTDAPFTLDAWWAMLCGVAVFTIGSTIIGWLVPARSWTQSRVIPVSSAGVGALVLLLTSWSMVRPDTLDVILNARFTIEVLVLVFFIMATRSRRDRLPLEHAVSVANVIVGVLSFSILSTEVILPWQREIAEAVSARRSTEPSWNALHITLSVAWIAYGVVAVVTGFVRRKRTIRLAGIGVLAVAILKVFLYDLSFLDTPSRMMSFGVLGLVLLGVSFAYNRWKHRIME